MISFPPTRQAAIDHLTRFVENGAADYGRLRNFDLPDHPHVSQLSPYLRHRIITEDEVLRAVLARHSYGKVEKFVQEVFWRTYWKGWLALRPSVWDSYQMDLKAALNRVQTEAGLRADWEAACRGETGISGFDEWAKQLVDTGYLHNHARMWFASIWIYTLHLPWELGADFFMRHLLDGDPASNTLSWRWVGGLQTQGKTYLARRDNIERYTMGRHAPQDLAAFAPALDGAPNPPRGEMPTSDTVMAKARTGWLITEEDLSAGWVNDTVASITATARLNSTAQRSPLEVSTMVTDWVDRACAAAAPEDCAVLTDPQGLAQWAKDHALEQVITSHAPIGPASDQLRTAASILAQEGIKLAQIIRPYDQKAWPHATHGFFRFKDKIPKLISAL